MIFKGSASQPISERSKPNLVQQSHNVGEPPVHRSMLDANEDASELPKQQLSGGSRDERFGSTVVGQIDQI